jgi:Serine dehydrogenase proteinase
MSENLFEKCQKIANRIATDMDADVLLYNGDLERPYDRKVLDLCEQRRRRPNVLFFLITPGGDGHAAYRIARYLQKKYGKFSLYISGICKSAGTIVALGAHELVISDHGELGPLDIQLVKADELWETSSGLTVLQALSALQVKSFDMFEEFFLTLKQRSGGQITLKTATEIAGKLATGLFRPIYEQIDPMHLGEATRAMNIARDYGERLGKNSHNLKEDALDVLTAAYPSHGFVIDRSEAEALFKQIREPSDDESALAKELEFCTRDPIPISKREMDPNSWTVA